MVIENYLNQIHLSDNLQFTSQLPNDSIDLIYADVLFNTKRQFKDFHDKVINPYGWYRDLFRELKRILKDTGTVYIHCDKTLVHRLKVIMDITFGRENFRNHIIWAYNSAPRKKKDFGYRHDDILRYSKTDNYWFDPPREPYTESSPKGYQKAKYYHPEGKVMGDVWFVPIIGQNDKTERVGYSTQKPVKLIDIIIKSSCPVGGIVYDPFMGSGTTAISAIKNGRNWIGCDINPNAINVTNKRIEGI